jgi:hypothetical protein
MYWEDHVKCTDCWDYARCADYVKKSAPPATRLGLLQTATMQYNKKFPNIIVKYYSMPDWLDIFNFAPRHIGKRRFESVVHEYHHMSQKYLQKVADVLDALAGLNKKQVLLTGRALLQEIAANSRRTVYIMPHWHWRRILLPGGARNAVPRPMYPGQTLNHVSDGVKPNTEAAYAKGVEILDEERWYRPTGQIGTGKGANVVLFYSPEDWEDKDKTDGPGFDPDEVMFHELVHISRQFRGLLNNAPVEGGFENHEEYLATTIANLYLSEKGKPLRGQYSGSDSHHTIKIGRDDFVVIQPPPRGWNVMKDPDNWYHHPGKVSISPRQLMQRFANTQKSFYLALRQLPDGKPKFNPVKQHFQQTEREKLRPDI